MKKEHEDGDRTLDLGMSEMDTFYSVCTQPQIVVWNHTQTCISEVDNKSALYHSSKILQNYPVVYLHSYKITCTYFKYFNNIL